MARMRSGSWKRWSRWLWLGAIAALLGCDGGTRGSGISGSTVSGSVAASSNGGIAADFSTTGVSEAIVVQVREAPEVQAVVDPVTHNFTLIDVPAGDVTIDFVGSSTASITLHGLPERVELRMVNVRFEGDQARPAGFAMIPEEGNSAEMVVSRRKGAAPLPVTFALSDLSLNAPLQFVWSFGDGTRSGRANTSHQYDAPGNYVVEARITSGNEEQRALEVIQVLAPGDRSLQVTAGGEPDRGLRPLSVVFTAHVVNNVGIVTFEWNFDDGTASGVGEAVRHTFTREGIFFVEVIARDQGGNEERDVVQVQVTSGIRPVPLNVEAEVNQPLGNAPHSVRFRALITGSGPVEIEWDFDDGTPPVADASPVHTYTAPGIYFATVTVTEVSTGDSVFDQVVVEVR